MTQIENLQAMAAMTALNEMLASDYFNVCTIDRVASMLGISVKGSAAYDVLHTLHCVHYQKMPPDLRSAIPDLISQCLSITPMRRFSMMPDTREPAQRFGLIDVEPPAKSGLLSFIKR